MCFSHGFSKSLKIKREGGKKEFTKDIEYIFLERLNKTTGQKN
jgi:hypothetical protein